MVTILATAALVGIIAMLLFALYAEWAEEEDDIWRGHRAKCNCVICNDTFGTVKKR